MRTILKILTLSIAVGSGVMSIRKHDTIKEYQDSPDSGAGIREVCLCVFYKFLVNDCPGLNSLERLANLLEWGYSGHQNWADK